MRRVAWDRWQQWPAGRWWLVIAVAVVILYGLAIWHNQSAVIDGRRVFWLQDDMMISMRYAQNLANGDGLVFNPGGERVEGYSNGGWVLVMAAVHLLPLPSTLTSLAVLAVNVTLSVVVLWLALQLMQRLVPQVGMAVPAALLALALINDLFRWTVIGLEIPLQTALFLWLLLRVMDEAEGERPKVTTFLAAGLLGIVRVDGVVLAGLLCLLAFLLATSPSKRSPASEDATSSIVSTWSSPARRRVLWLSGLVLALPLLQVAFRLAYYGYPLPNTYYLKLAEYGERWWPGVVYAGRFLRLYGIVWLVALAGVIASGDRRARALWLLGLPLLAYAVYAGGDDFGGSRFLAAWLPVLLALAFLTPYWFGWQARPLAYGLSLLTVLAATVALARYRFWAGPGDEWVMAKAGLALRQSTLPQTTIGAFWAGTLPYFAERPVVDMLGKNDEQVARLPARPGSHHPGHNKFDYRYSLGVLRPDLLVSALALEVAADPEQLAGMMEGDFAYAGRLFADETFQAEYAPSLVYVEGLPLFVGSGSPERGRLMQGDCRPVENGNLQAFGLETVCWLRGGN
jgi:hypothetical protein